jgi:hypothetical protein
VQYKAALKILIKTKELEREASSSEDAANELARLTAILMQLPMGQKHTIICQKMAMRRNMDAGNFGVAARVIRLLLENSPDVFKRGLQEKLEECEDHKLTNAMPESVCAEKVFFFIMFGF